AAYVCPSPSLVPSRRASDHIRGPTLPCQSRGILQRAVKDPKRGNAKYVTSFSMFDKNGQPLYWLIFCTNNLRGLEEMKKAMWAIDKTGEFRFSDEDNPSQLRMFNETYDPTWLAAKLATALAGKTV